MAGWTALGLIGAGSASAYPEQTCNVVVDQQAVQAGKSLEVSGTLSTAPGAEAAAGARWRVTFNGKVAESVGPSFRHIFRIPEVTRDTTLRVKATATAGDLVCHRSLDVAVNGGDVLPPGTGLPNTGGPRLELLLLGLGSLAAGVLVLLRSKRRTAAIG